MGSEYIKNKKILVTGGAGFVGSNLINNLVNLGAQVIAVDNFHKDYGGNEFNLKNVMNKIELIRGDITDRELMTKLCSGVEIVYHIAAQCSHVDSMIDPWLDLNYNCFGTLSILEAVKKSPKKPKIVYAGTRAIIGAPLVSPATEKVLPNPTDVYGVNKHAAELYGSVYARVHKIPFVSLRLTNSYGSYHQMKNGKYGILNWFISLALQNKPIKIYGTGEQLRDYLYIDDAIETFVAAAEFADKISNGLIEAEKVQNAGVKIPYAVFNIVSGSPLKFVDCAKKIVEITKTPLEFIPWPADRAAIETGDFIADASCAQECFNWKPKTSFDLGLKKTIDFYKENLKYYL
jgi:nucleoside-diphosphate-sugar epimerase